MFRHECVRVVAWPASRPGKGDRKVQCTSCGVRFGLPICALTERPLVITFPAHAPVRRPQRLTAAEGCGPTGCLCDLFAGSLNCENFCARQLAAA